MAHCEQQNGFEVWTIKSADGLTRASFVPELGGIGSSIVMPGPSGPRELLYQHSFFWNKKEKHLRGGLPFLFPVCGRVELDGKADTYQVGGQTYYLPIHGFAAHLPWQVLDTGRPDELALELYDTDVTRAKYPFAFVVSLRYRIEPGRLICRQSYKNVSDRPMPYYAGFHPYFLVPGQGSGKERVRIEFHPQRRLAYNARLSDVVGELPLPTLPISAADPHASEMLIELNRRKESRLSLPEGCTIHMEAAGPDDPNLFPYLQLYTQPEQPFFCIEPWMGVPNSLNHPERTRWLKPGQSERGQLSLWTTG